MLWTEANAPTIPMNDWEREEFLLNMYDEMWDRYRDLLDVRASDIVSYSGLLRDRVNLDMMLCDIEGWFPKDSHLERVA